jgi:hypothetical protein
LRTRSVSTIAILYVQVLHRSVCNYFYCISHLQFLFVNALDLIRSFLAILCPRPLYTPPAPSSYFMPTPQPIESFIELLEMDMAQTIAFARHAYRLSAQRQVSRGEPLLPPVDGRFRAEKLADLDLDDTLDSEIDELKRISEAFGNVAPGADPVGIHGLRAKAGVGGVVQAAHSAQMAELIRAEMAMQQRR